MDSVPSTSLSDRNAEACKPPFPLYLSLMARLSTLALVLCFLAITHASSAEARKLLSTEKITVSSQEDTLALRVHPEGSTPPSAPSGEGHELVINERLFVLHLAHLDRVLQSVPSPGVGH
ncbi:hypothetical protein RJ639_041785 [Escallonia herrerae]|uniref:Uncharacterized protein n=1 Tax=Escallonia herrerae TaxID=1293975 RepID=A0AA89B5B1_9ASTE|nr:hypothetical protein RJ639_041785 [Escallonia herrerae]